MAILGCDGVVEKLMSPKNAFSSWDNFKHAVQVKNTLSEHDTAYHNADPLWMNEGKI